MGPFCVSESFSYGKKFKDNRWGVSSYSVEIVFVSECRKSSRENPSMFQKITNGKKIMDKKWGLLLFSVEIFLSHSAEKKIVQELFCVSKKTVRKVSRIGWGGIMFFSKLFCFTGPKNFEWGPFGVEEDFW